MFPQRSEFLRNVSISKIYGCSVDCWRHVFALDSLSVYQKKLLQEYYSGRIRRKRNINNFSFTRISDAAIKYLICKENKRKNHSLLSWLLLPRTSLLGARDIFVFSRTNIGATGIHAFRWAGAGGGRIPQPQNLWTFSSLEGKPKIRVFICCRTTFSFLREVNRENVARFSNKNVMQ